MRLGHQSIVQPERSDEVRGSGQYGRTRRTGGMGLKKRGTELFCDPESGGWRVKLYKRFANHMLV